jgi:hypothetical protein
MSHKLLQIDGFEEVEQEKQYRTYMYHQCTGEVCVKLHSQITAATFNATCGDISDRKQARDKIVELKTANHFFSKR